MRADALHYNKLMDVVRKLSMICLLFWMLMTILIVVIYNSNIFGEFDFKYLMYCCFVVFIPLLYSMILLVLIKTYPLIFISGDERFSKELLKILTLNSRIFNGNPKGN